MYASTMTGIKSGSMINVSLAKKGIYIVKIASSSGIYAFKAVGSNEINKFTTGLYNGSTAIQSGFKSALLSAASDFSFNIGDSLRVSIYKSGLYARPKIMVISSSYPTLTYRAILPDILILSKTPSLQSA